LTIEQLINRALNKEIVDFLLLILLFPSICISQPDCTSSYYNKIDSLEKLLPGSVAEKCVDLQNELAYCFAPLNFDSSIYYSSRAEQLASLHDYSLGSGIAKFQAGNAYYYKMDFKNALISYLSAQQILESGHSYTELGELYCMMGHMNFFITRSDKAASYYLKAISCYKASGNTESLDNTYALLAMTLSFLGGPPIDSALFYAYKMLDYARRIRDPRKEAHALMVLGTVYLIENKSLSIKQKFLAFNDTALQMVTAFQDEDRMCIIHVNTGTYYDDGYPSTRNTELAKLNYEKGLELARKTNNRYMQSLCLIRLSNYDIQEGKYKQAETRLDSSEANLNEFFKMEALSPPVQIFNPFEKIFTYYLAKREKTSLFQSRFNLAMAQGEYRKAIEYQQLAYQSEKELRAEQQGQQLDMLMAEDEAKKIRSLAQDYELSRLKLSRSRFMFVGTGAGIIIIGMFLLLYFQRKRWKAEQRSITLEQQLLRSQMNPHFIFNSLASIQNFVVNHRANEASIYLSRFSQLVRNILDNSTEEYVPLQKEIETIRHYLELQKVRYAGQFTYNLTVDDRIDEEAMMIPPMLAQPFIENAIEHGIKYKETTGHLWIRFILEENLIRFEVEDDGVGREKAYEIESKHNQIHRSLSTSITHDRLVKLNKKSKTKIRMEITDLKNDLGEACGTKVTFGIPVMES
jgi:hypothetical protein